jgi:hypothetical protein
MARAQAEIRASCREFGSSGVRELEVRVACSDGVKIPQRSDLASQRANLLLFGLAAWMLVVGVRRAFEADSVHPMKVMAIGGVVVVSMASCTLFLLVRFVWAVGLPASTRAPEVGSRAPNSRC